MGSHRAWLTGVVVATGGAMLAACAPLPSVAPGVSPPLATSAIIVTNEAGDRLARRPDVLFVDGAASGAVIDVFPSDVRQTLLGIGSSFTESSAFVLAHLEPARRLEVMREAFGEQGANFSLARTPIGSTDFSVEGKYSYAPAPGDVALASFSTAPDRAGFDASRYPQVMDDTYDVLPMITEALAIKSEQAAQDLRIIASAWTAPPWMKTIDTWYINPTPETNWQGTGGELKSQYESTYADYLIRYLDDYAARGVDIWGLTPVNEPHGNSGQWESMQFTPQTQNRFIKKYLGPRLTRSDHADIKLLIYDQNRDDLEAWTNLMFADPQTAPYLFGAAVHWYSSTIDVYEDTFERVNAAFPSFALIHTEGTIDDLGKPAPGGILDPENFEESDWFGNDAFWWNANATDWAYTATWAPDAKNHPRYVPVHRYARDIIVGFNHWLAGWIDWNLVLDANGGPNHVGNFCGAPIMIDTQSGEIYYTPVYYVLAQLSSTIRPGDRAVRTQTTHSGLDADTLHASASVNDDGLLSVQILNTSQSPLDLALRIGARHASISMDANALYTIRVPLTP
ncbi:MAG: glycoside hydrolase family 30 beta sandwich domain-containing protein [Gammaproteobacteria bacterium]